MYNYQSYSPEETLRLGQRLGSLLQGHEIIALEGELGAGKTLLARGMIEGLGIHDYITSPTFTIINEYHHHISIYHMDLYRISEVEELDELGFEDYLYGEGLKIIEWPAVVKSLFPPTYLEIHITSTSPIERSIALKPYGETYRRLLEELLGHAGARS